MNSTEKQEKALTKFFNNEILPLHQKMGKTVLSGDKEKESYFIVRERKTFDKKNFELSLGNEKEIIAALESILDGTPLKPIAKKIMKLKPLFKEIQQSDSVSPFIYEMF